jgi:hypothetical protein
LQNLRAHLGGYEVKRRDPHRLDALCQALAAFPGRQSRGGIYLKCTNEGGKANAKKNDFSRQEIEGKSSPIAQNIYVVDGAVAIKHAVAWIADYARSQGRLDELLIMCHGLEANWDLGHQTCTTKEVGGFGLELCKEGLSLYNVGLVRQWKGLITSITVYACAPADTGPGNEGTAGDGRRFMGEMAMFSGAEVVAARDTQSYSGATSTIDFGKWEGPVFRLYPIGPSLPFVPGPMQ